MSGPLAIHGGSPVRDRPFPRFNSIGAAERAAVIEVLDSGSLSGFLGADTPEFYGGERVRGLETAWRKHFRVGNAVALNSATSGLYAAIGAARVGPGDEVIVSPFTMSASATAPLVYGAVPVFADVDPQTFCLDPASVAERLTPRTKAIVVVDLFGHPADMPALMAIAADHGLVVVEDAAQAPGATLNGRPAGTFGDLGVFSLNRHKTIHCGEGGIVVTESGDLAERLRLIRNHGEVVAAQRGLEDIVNIVGFNYRMTEIEAAIALAQLGRLDGLVERRQDAARRLTAALDGLPGLRPPVVAEGVGHGWYFYGMRYDPSETAVSRASVAAALRAEGIPVSEGYTEPLYLQPLYQRRIAFGANGFPWTAAEYTGSVDYGIGTCPVAEELWASTLLVTDLCHGMLSDADLDDVGEAFRRVFAGLHSLREPSAVT